MPITGASIVSATITVTAQFTQVTGVGVGHVSMNSLGGGSLIGGAATVSFGPSTITTSVNPAIIGASGFKVLVEIFATTGGNRLPSLDTLEVSDLYGTLTMSDGNTVIVRPTGCTVTAGDTFYTGHVAEGSAGPPASARYVWGVYGGLVNFPGVFLTDWNVPTPVTPDWLLINEPSLGITDRTPYLFRGEGKKHDWALNLRQRGQAAIDIEIAAGDPYTVTRGTPVYLFDETPGPVWTLVFAGLIQDFELKFIGLKGYRRILITAVSLESIYDTVYVNKPVQYVAQTAGFIVRDLHTRFQSVAPGSDQLVTLGDIGTGATIPLFNAKVGDKLSDLFSQLATTSLYTGGVNPQTQQLFFQDPASLPAPYTLRDLQVLWPDEPSLSWKVNGADYRNRQGAKLSYDTFPHSCEFFVGTGQRIIQLARPIEQITNAWATLSTCNTAVGTLSGLPSVGDTITIALPTGTWIASHAYALGGKLIDANGFVQEVTTAGTSGSSLPAFSDITTGTTIDGSVIWTCRGAAGLSTGDRTYTFVAAIDNREIDQILIAGTVAEQIQYIVDAINANADTRSTTFSLPTWENALCNAINPTATNFTLQQKHAGTGYTSALSSNTNSSPFSLAFTWSSTATTGGTSPQGSLGPGEGATISLQVYVFGTTIAAPGVAYTPGDTYITLATPLNVGSNLNIEYTRADGNVMEVENTALVTALATITHGTGKYQQMADLSSQGLLSTSLAGALQLIQQALAAYSVAPNKLEFLTYKPGLFPGQTLSVSLTKPVETSPIVNNDWIIEEVSAEFLNQGEAKRYLDIYGHYRYTVRMANISEIGSYLDFWKGQSGGGTGGGGGAPGSALVATSGGGKPTTAETGGAYPLGVKIKTGSYTATSTDADSLIVFEDASPITAATLTLPATAPSTVWQIEIENASSNSITIARNGKLIDAVAANLTLKAGQGIEIRTDGTNYFTQRGGSFTSPLTTKGDIFTRSSTADARLGVGTNGQVLTANSSATNGVDYEAPIALTTTGSSGAATLTPGNPYVLNVPQYGGGGGGSGPYPTLTTPPASSWTAVNIGSSVFTTLGSGALTLTCAADATNQMKMEVRSTPAAPWTLTAAIAPGFLGAATYPSGGICLRESATGKIYMFGFYANALGGNQVDLGILSWTSPTSGGSDLGTQLLIMGGGLLWLRFALDTGTSCSGGPCITWSYSMDGNYWIEVLKVSKTALFTTGPDQAGIFVNPRNGTYGCGLTLYSWDGVP